MTRRLHRILARLWIAPVRLIGRLHCIEAWCQRRSAMHQARALGHDMDALLARLAQRKAAR